MEAGVDGLLRDKTRPPGKAPIPDDRVAEVVRLTLAPPPHEATHWTVRAMAKTVGMAVATVQDIWKAHGLAPHRWRAFKLSNDPAFVAKLEDIVGLYVAPPAHAVVLSIDEKSQIMALDRTRRGLLRQAYPPAPEAIPSSTSTPPSTASSMSTTRPPSHSSGKPIPTTSSPLVQEGSKRWSQSTSLVESREWAALRLFDISSVIYRG